MRTSKKLFVKVSTNKYFINHYISKKRRKQKILLDYHIYQLPANNFFQLIFLQHFNLVMHWGDSLIYANEKLNEGAFTAYFSQSKIKWDPCCWFVWKQVFKDNIIIPLQRMCQCISVLSKAGITSNLWPNVFSTLKRLLALHVH